MVEQPRPRLARWRRSTARATSPSRATCRRRWPAPSATALRAHPGDVLAFLPGWGEIRRTAERLAGLDAEVLPLHGEMPPAEQDRALNPGPAPQGGAGHLHRRDLADRARRADRGRWRLPPHAAARPRHRPRPPRHRPHQPAPPPSSGPAAPGATAPGVAIRLWSEALHRGLAPQDRPEILEAELSGLALDLAAWGAAPGDLALLDPPPAGALAAARALLRDLDALDARRRHHRRPAGAWPGSAPIRAWPAMLAAAEHEGEKALAADLAALLEERDPIRGREAPLRHHPAARPAARRRPPERRPRRASSASAAPPRCTGAGSACMARPCRRATRARCWPPASPTASPPCAASWPAPSASPRGQGARLAGHRPAGQGAAAGRRRPRTAGHRGAHPHGRAARPRRAGGPLPRALRREEGAAFDARTGAVLARRRLRFGPLVLEEQPLPNPDPAVVAAALAAAVADRGLRDLPWSDGGAAAPGPARLDAPGGGRGLARCRRRRAGRHGAGLAGAAPARPLPADGAGRAGPAGPAAGRAALGAAAAAGRRAARRGCRCPPAAAPPSTTTGDTPTLEARPQHLFGLAPAAAAGGGAGAAAGRAALAGRAAGRGHRRPRRLLEGRLGGGAQGDARPLPAARLAGGPGRRRCRTRRGRRAAADRFRPAREVEGSHPSAQSLDRPLLPAPPASAPPAPAGQGSRPHVRPALASPPRPSPGRRAACAGCTGSPGPRRRPARPAAGLRRPGRAGAARGGEHRRHRRADGAAAARGARHARWSATSATGCATAGRRSPAPAPASSSTPPASSSPTTTSSAAPPAWWSRCRTAPSCPPAWSARTS